MRCVHRGFGHPWEIEELTSFCLDDFRVAISRSLLRSVSKAGMILFANNVRTVIPLSNYTHDQWFAQVEAIRAQNIQVGGASWGGDGWACRESATLTFIFIIVF